MTTVAEKVVDWWVKGLQISACYKEDWAYISKVFHDLNLNIDCHSPIITMNEVQNVRYAHHLSGAMHHQYPEYSQSNLFLVILRAMPIYTRQHSCHAFEQNICTPSQIDRLLGVRGTIKETYQQFEEMIGEKARLYEKSYNPTRKGSSVPI